MSAIIKLRPVRGILATAIKLQDESRYYDASLYPSSGWYATGPWIVAVRKDEQNSIKSSAWAFPAEFFENAELELPLEEKRAEEQRPFESFELQAKLEPGAEGGAVTAKDLLSALVLVVNHPRS